MVTGHHWETDPDSKEPYPVMLCMRCGKLRELTEVLVDRDALDDLSPLPPRFVGRQGGLRRVRDN